MSTFLETQVEKVAFDTPDNWELIKVIANMLSRDPRLSIKELVDNALGISETPNIRKHVRVIIRKKEKKDPHIKIVDNGSGWFVDGESSSTYYGKPNLHYTVKHIGDSVKNKFEVYRRAREEGDRKSVV